MASTTDVSYTIQNANGSITVSSKFAKACECIKNLFEATDDDSNEEPIPITDAFDLNKIKKADEFFGELQALEVDEKPYLNYMDENLNDFKKKYSHNGLNIPHVNEILEIYEKYKNDMAVFPEYNSYLNNSKLMLGVCLCLLSIIRLRPVEGDEIVEHIMDMLQKDHSLF
jgi:hypothetical protein